VAIKNDLVRHKPRSTGSKGHKLDNVQEATWGSAEDYSTLVENIPDAITKSRAGVIVWCNDRVEEVFGYKKDELIGTDGSFFFPDDIDPAEMTETVYHKTAEQRHFRGTTRVKKKDGSIAYVEFSISRITGKESPEFITIARDVTERRQRELEKTERAVERRERYFQSLIENSSDVVIILESDATIRYESPSTHNLTGYSPEELHDRSVFDLIHPDDTPIAANTISQMLNNQIQNMRIELRARHKDGSWRYIDAVCSNLLHDPEVSGIVVNFRDITERKLAEEELRVKQNALDNSINAIAIFDIEGNIIYVNQSCLRLWGINKKEEILGKPYSELLRPDMVADFMSIAESIINYGSWEGELAGTNRDGKDICVQLQSSIVKDALGNPILIISSFINITERKQAEKALQESEEKLRGLVEEMNDGYCVIQESRVVFANTRIAEMFGYAQGEVIGKTIQQLLPPGIVEELIEVYRRRKHGEIVPQQYETTLVGKDGTTCPVEFGARLIDYAGKPAVSVVIRDITERKQAEKGKQRMEQQLQLSGRLAAVGELAAGIAHELNNPLAAIQAFAQLLNEREDLDETTKSDVATIYKEAQRASRITSNMLSFSRKHKPEKRLISINEAIEKSLELHAYQMKVNNIDLVTELEPDLPLTLADFHQLLQVFVNLVTNAEQAMTEAHGRGKLRIETRKADEVIQIRFIDDGPGIPYENLKSMFDPFFTTKDVGRGTGLGLSICYGIVQGHNGQIYARSELGKGATFVVELPIISEEQPSA
jgi:PAS domain S-box-containing protein